jgi:hypothetical protein
MCNVGRKYVLYRALADRQGQLAGYFEYVEDLLFRTLLAKTCTLGQSLVNDSFQKTTYENAL